jgi:hypothetical protein
MENGCVKYYSDLLEIAAPWRVFMIVVTDSVPLKLSLPSRTTTAGEKSPRLMFKPDLSSGPPLRSKLGPSGPWLAFIFKPVEPGLGLMFEDDESGPVLIFIMGTGTERTKSPAEKIRNIEE